MPALPLTPEQLEDAARLKKLFSQWQRARKDAREPSSQEAASEFLGFNQSALSQYLNGLIPLNVGAASKFAQLLGCTIADISPRLEEHVAELASVATVGTAVNDEPPLPAGTMKVVVGEDPDTVEIRKVKLKLRAGVSQYETEPLIEDGASLKIPRQVLEAEKLSPANLLAIAVKGQSMEPLMFEDDIIVINTADKKLANRELFALNFNGDCCVKQVIKRNGDWYLYSVNPDFGPVNARSGECNVIGRVVYQPGRVLTGRL